MRREYTCLVARLPHRPFWLGVSDVTQHEWQVVLGNNLSHARAGGGNVWERTQDEYSPNSTGATTDPVASCSASLKVIRGFSLGFRVVREAGI